METVAAHEPYREAKAYVLLCYFHALRYPNAPWHHYRFTAAEREELPEDTESVPEEILTRAGLTVLAREREIRLQFRGMLRTQGIDAIGEGTYGSIVGLCETARLDFHAAEDLLDETGRQLLSDEILPGREVVEAMTFDFVLHDHERCEPLEQFISQLSTATE